MASTATDMAMTTRGEKRVEYPLIAQVRRQGGSAQPVTIRDISSGGLQGTCFNAPQEGEQVSVRFENNHSVHGIVRWVRKGVFGVEFRNPVNVALVTASAKTHPLRRSTDIR